jgi:hypothetical protein
VRQFDCETDFSANEAGSCWKDNEAGIRWGFTPDATEYCAKQLKQIDVTVSSDNFPTTKFKTIVPGAYRAIGVRDLPKTFMDTNLLFTVDPIMNDGEKLLASPKTIPLPLDKNKGSCSTAGIPVTDAFGSWNANNNLYRYHWHSGGGGWGSRWGNFEGKRLFDTGETTHGASGVETVPKGTIAGTYCRYGGGKDMNPSQYEIFPNKQYRIKNDCWFSRNNQWVEQV